MNKLITLFLIIFCIQAKAQQPTKPDTLQAEEMVLTPKGLRPKSTVHHIERGCHLSRENGHLKKIETKTGKVIEDYSAAPAGTNTQKKNTDKKKLTSSSTGPTSYGSGWITYSYWQNNSSANPISYFSTNWIVPTAPVVNDGQTIFLFNGIEPTDMSYILQPVLQWGYSAAGGGSYWSITNWYVGDTSVWGDSLIPVSPGTNLQGIMALTAQSGSNFSYNSSFVGYPGCSLQVNNIPKLTWADQTLECYGITQYADYPADTAVRMSAIVMQTGTVSPALNWGIDNAVTDVGQHTLVPSNSATNGEVDLYFHYPNRAGIISLSANGLTCSDTVIALIAQLQYHGSSVLTTCVLNYQVDLGSVQTYTWNGSLTSGQTTGVNLPSFVASAGGHTLTCYCSNANDSTNGYFYDSQSSITFHVVSEASLPFVEGFETNTCPSGLLPNTNWNVSHSAASGINFAISSAAAATGSQSCMLNNLSNGSGDTSIIQTTSSYDMTLLTSPTLIFKTAYQQKATTNNDKLQVFTSTDCGNTWVSRRVITSTALASLAGGTGTSDYVPTSAQFTTYTVGITAVANSHNVLFRWMFIAGSSLGNDLYIDDIDILETSGIEQYNATNTVGVYPNPTNAMLNLQMSQFGNLKMVGIEIINMLGEKVYSTNYQINSSANYQIDVSGLPAGVYFVRTLQGTQKFVKQ